MKIYDIHIHADNTVPSPVELIERLEKARIYGGCVFSNWPDRANQKKGSSFEQRLEEVLLWTKGYEDRLFPVIWIHPYEANIISNIKKAVDKGIAGFKIICTDFYVYEKESIAVIEEIAKYNKPVFFHSGILWDGEISSEFNRPLNWEALLKIKNLKFSMGHCSWPWIDECISLYGKFLNSKTYTDNTSEMFFDITPGTPEMYRKELISKLYTIGYDVSDNVLFGTDAYAHDYSVSWAEKWLDTDRKVMDEIGVSKENREKMYERNLMRFLGKTKLERNKAIPVTDNAGGWVCYNTNINELIERWYKALPFSRDYDKEFYNSLKNYNISDAITIESYDKEEADGKRNLLSYLFMCEELKHKYQKAGISEEILYETLKDIVIWTNIWSDIKGELFLGELEWLSKHLSMKLFKLGRLQFLIGKAEYDIDEKDVKKGDNVIEIHIPEGEPLDIKECKASVEQAKAFFKVYFPELEYKCFTCHSWLLDKGLNEYLDENSNIIKFQNMFKVVAEEKSDAIIKYVFQWNARRRNINSCYGKTSFSKAIKKSILSGGEFFEAYGFLK